MNKYELALVLNPTLDEEARTEAFNKVQDLITRFGGTIEKVDDWGKKRLAYEIFITFDAAPTAPIEIESRVRIMENVLRYLIIRKDA